MAPNIFVMIPEKEKDKALELVDMITRLARLDFSGRVPTDMTNDPLDLIAYGLNMLSEELEYNVVKRSRLEEINNNLERFSFTVAHDLKSPIHSSTGIIELMEDDLKNNNNENMHLYIEMLKMANAKIVRLVNGILGYSRLEVEHIEMSTIDLQQLCNEVLEAYEADPAIEISTDENLPLVKHNETALSQVITNLISNAIKYNDKDICKIHIGCSEKDDHFEVSIRDNGPGINEKDAAIIFKLFENLQSTRSGSTGIGLAIVEKIITQTGGRVWVDCRSTDGATFKFTIRK